MSYWDTTLLGFWKALTYGYEVDGAPRRSSLNFKGLVTLADNPGLDAIDVNIGSTPAGTTKGSSVVWNGTSWVELPSAAAVGLLANQDSQNVDVTSPAGIYDGVVLSVGQVLALAWQTNANENGLWTFNGAGVPLTRVPIDVPGSTAIAGVSVPVTGGALLGGARVRRVSATALKIDLADVVRSKSSIASNASYTFSIPLIDNAINVVRAVHTVLDGTLSEIGIYSVASGVVTQLQAPAARDPNYTTASHIVSWNTSNSPPTVTIQFTNKAAVASPWTMRAWVDGVAP